jgi:hypothetical protein
VEETGRAPRTKAALRGSRTPRGGVIGFVVVVLMSLCVRRRSFRRVSSARRVLILDHVPQMIGQQHKLYIVLYMFTLSYGTCKGKSITTGRLSMRAAAASTTKQLTTKPTTASSYIQYPTQCSRLIGNVSHIPRLDIFVVPKVLIAGRPLSVYCGILRRLGIVNSREMSNKLNVPPPECSMTV